MYLILDYFPRPTDSVTEYTVYAHITFQKSELIHICLLSFQKRDYRSVFIQSPNKVIEVWSKFSPKALF